MNNIAANIQVGQSVLISDTDNRTIVVKKVQIGANTQINVFGVNARGRKVTHSVSMNRPVYIVK